MNYKNFLSFILLLVCSSSAVAEDERPNFLVILADDVSPEAFSAYGIADPMNTDTPNIDRIAAKGVAFATTLAPAICQPSRVQLLTGRYPHKTGNYYNGVWQGVAQADVYQEFIPFSKRLKDAGYATAVAGKWDAGGRKGITSDLGFDQYLIYSSHRQISRLTNFKRWQGVAYYEQKDRNPSRYWFPAYVSNVVYNEKNKSFTDQLQTNNLVMSQLQDYGPDLEAKFLSSFIKQSVAKKQPFLAYWPTVAPHGTGRGRLPSTPLRGTMGDLGSGVDGSLKIRPNSTEYIARFKSLVTYMDTKVGQVLRVIDDLGVADNTVVLFASDNATAIAGKTRGVERGSHVALMISGPNILKRPGLTENITDTTDIAPTLLELAQLNLVTPLDGVSLVPLLTGKTTHHRNWVYAATGGSQIIRTPNYLLEAMNHLYSDHPEAKQGRFYFTGNNRFGRNYQLLSEKSSAAHLNNRAVIKQLISTENLPSLLPSMLTGKQLNILTNGNDTRFEKHLFNDKYHQYYLQNFALPNKQ